MKNYKIVATDLDGTLLGWQGFLTEENSRAISELHQRGVIFVPTTGRALSEIPRAVREHPAVRYIISSNGASIYDKETGKSDNANMDRETSGRVYRIMRKYPFFFSNHVDNVSYIDASIPEESVTDYGITPYYVNFFKEVATPRENYDEFFLSNPEVEMFAGFISDPEKMLLAREELRGVEGIVFTTSTTGDIEIFSPLAGKGNGVCRLASALGIPLDEVITAGDNHNDLDMLKISGASVASLWAIPEVKAETTHVQDEGHPHICEYIRDSFFK
jgi:Cof subfamily protein (haloacid dehalogenase superfamily)